MDLKIWKIDGGCRGGCGSTELGWINLSWWSCWRTQPGCLLLPADGRLAVCRPLGGAQRLAHLGLRQAQGKPADLERFGKFPNLLQVDPVHLAGGGLRVCGTQHTRNYLHFPVNRLLFPEWMEPIFRHTWRFLSLHRLEIKWEVRTCFFYAFVLFPRHECRLELNCKFWPNVRRAFYMKRWMSQAWLFFFFLNLSPFECILNAGNRK